MAANGPGQDPNGDDLARPQQAGGDRLSALDARLKAASLADQARSGAGARGPDKGYRQGSRVLAELVAGPAGGALLGWLLDRLLGTSPWALLVMMILGIVVAFRNIYRISQARPE